MAKNSPLFVDIGQGVSILAGLLTIDSWKSKERPKNAKVGTFGFNSQTKSLEYWDGKEWLAASMNKG